MITRQFVAAKAFLFFEDKLLLLREASTYTDGVHLAEYDVPGGRVDFGETVEETLLREIWEEAGIPPDAVTIEKQFAYGEWNPKRSKDEQWQIVGLFFICRSSTDVVNLSSDHDEYQWIDPRDYQKYPIIKTYLPAFKDYVETI